MATRRVEFRWPLLAHPLMIGLGIIALLGVLRAAVAIHDVLLLGFLAVLVATLFSFPVALLQRWIPRGLAVLATLLAVIGLATGLGLLAYPVVSKQAQSLMSTVPSGLKQVQRWLSPHNADGPVARLPPAQKQQVAEKVQSQVGEAAGALVVKAVPAAMTATEGLTAVILLLVLAAFLVHEPEVYRRGLRALVPSQYEAVFDESWRRVGRDLRHWVGGILVSMVIMGTFCGAGLALVGLDDWFLLGLLTFVGTFVPYAGAIASAVPGLIIALAQSPRHFLLAGLVYLGVHIVEGYIVQPFVMKRAVELRPALLLFGQACLGAVFGIMGIVVATPLMVCGRALVQYLWVERRLGKGGAADAPV